jgi:uncharacterized protein YcaQ
MDRCGLSKTTTAKLLTGISCPGKRENLMSQMMRRNSLSLSEARRIVLHAQGFDLPTPKRVTSRHIGAVIARIGMLQIDSVNVLVRAHYFPLFSRLGPYPCDLLDRTSYSRKHRKLFEYWGHEASLLPMEMHRFLRWRMERARNFAGTWQRVARLARNRPEIVEKVREIVGEHGPASAGEIERHLAAERPRGTGGWWGWTESKTALEWLFWCGAVTTAARRNFERLYDLTERVIPSSVLNSPSPSLQESQRELVKIAARALGLASELDLRDYFRLRPEEARARIEELVEAGELVPVTVDHWKAYLHPDAKIPRRADAGALISPFDPLIWERKRVERLFQFHYRIGIYTPPHKREHGYYVLPFLLGDRLVARVDLKADRKDGKLQVLASHAEEEVDRLKVAEALGDELALLARWLALKRISVIERGDLAKSLLQVVDSRKSADASRISA